MASVLTLWLCVGCATSSHRAGSGLFQAAAAPVWSVKHTPRELVVSVSPVRRTLQIGGTYPAFLGAGIDIFQNEPYRRALRELTEGYDPGEAFESRLRAGLNAAIAPAPDQVAPLGSPAPYASVRDAQLARLERLAKEGADAVLDLRISYGVYGSSGLLVAKINGTLNEARGGRRLWRDHLAVSLDPVLGTVSLEDPTHRMFANFSSPGFKVKDDAITEWTEDAGETFRSDYEQTVDAAVEALLCDLGLRETSEGYYHLGKSALMHKRFADADAHFRKALTLDDDNRDARNGLVVSLGRNGQTDAALVLAERLVADEPAFGPGWLNLAWLHAIKNKDPELAAEPYRRAQALGMPRSKRIERKIK